ncbi:hypothetical protein R1sor_004455 [Riccia sorocarpa]|uniref:Magnesium transporter n=1 Tax=Riccia sorocarpa TaxID=122646 RepID=A0ABD3HKR8_9MARC
MANPVIRKLVQRVPYTLLEGADPNRVDVPMAPVGPSTQQVGPLVKKKKPGFRQWLRFDSSGAMELLELDRNAIMERLSIPARDLRILGPVFSQSSHILARERAMIVNLEFIRAIVTAEEVFILETSDPDVHPFVDQLKEHFAARYHSASPGGYNQLRLVDVGGGAYNGSEEMGVLVPRSSPGNGNDEENPDQLPDQLPFEFGVLEVALDVVCQFLDRSVRELELKANHTLDEFTRNITWSNIELVRSLKSDLTQLTGRVQKVRDELEQLLDDDKDMADLYLTRKLAHSQHLDSASASFQDDGYSKVSHFHGTASLASSVSLGNEDVEELEMLLEAYFMQLDGTLNRLTMIREHIDDTEDYINIQLDHQRNQLFQLQITLSTGALAIAIATALCSACSMNIQWVYIYDPANNVFVPYVSFTLVFSVTVFFSILGYVYWTGLFER